MEFIKNFPFFSIMLGMFSAIVSSVLGAKAAKYVARTALFIIMVLSGVLLWYTYAQGGGSYVFIMGHFPAPWGNEIRGGSLEALFAVFVSFIAFFCVIGGSKAVESDIEEKKQSLFYILVMLMTSSLIAMCYTNDLFTGYVFIEINTIAGCGLIMIRQTGKSIVTAVRYMVISLMGSGLFLIGVTMLYTITGHLLMSPIQETVRELAATGDYSTQLTIIIGLMTVGLAIKSGLFPFHMWIPDAYGQSNVVSSCLLSSVVSKGYIFLLIKIYFRTLGFDIVKDSGVLEVVFIFGIAGIIIGSLMALREKSLRRMIAYSSIAQIGYVYMGIGLGSLAGVAAAIFHILAHGVTKSLLFLSSAEFTDGSHARRIESLKGEASQHKASALSYAIGAFSITGFPLLAGFVSKLLLGGAAIGLRTRQWFALIALAISTILNAFYFLRTVVFMFIAPSEEHDAEIDIEKGPEKFVSIINVRNPLYDLALLALIAVNFILGLFSGPIIDVINEGLGLFS
ncbi:MAG: sodium:proton antiporter [Lachnospiraceae bacterium]|nr:sodium:proton antiporter [Lachnospiraceae bacterium]